MALRQSEITDLAGWIRRLIDQDDKAAGTVFIKTELIAVMPEEKQEALYDKLIEAVISSVQARKDRDATTLGDELTGLIERRRSQV